MDTINCIFCKISRREIASEIVFEDDYTVVFMELKPSSPGHVMVIYKRHGESILDYNEKELGKIMLTVQKIAKKLQKALSCDAITIGINHFESRGVPHLHIHLIPRWKNDKGGVIQSIVRNNFKEDRKIIAEKIRVA